MYGRTLWGSFFRLPRSDIIVNHEAADGSRFLVRAACGFSCSAGWPNW